jgi:16S rRNA (cytidine1402-2'-O)-methyltransferase
VSVAEHRGAVYVVSTPIGNLEDLSPRAERVLREVAVIACEDTRHTGRLCARLGIRTRRVSLHAHNEARRAAELLRRLARGESIALVSDAGTPLLSDPGERLVAAAANAGHRVIPLPGPSAALAALVASGLPTRPFTFLGFPPRKGGERRRWLETARQAPGTLILFEAPRRVSATLRDLHSALGPRRVAVGRELTKRFEEVLRGRLGEIDVGEPRGEVTIVVEGGEAQTEAEEGSSDILEALLERGMRPTEAARELSRACGLSRREAYRRLLERGRR